jgi:hypothetical protein
MNNLALAVHIIKANQALSSQFSYQGNWDSFVVITFNDFQEINAQDLKDHDKVLSVWSIMDKRIEQLDAVGSVSS